MRKAFSTVRTAGQIESGGQRAHAQGLVAALQAAADSESEESLTHGLHSFSARMHPATAKALVALAVPKAKRNATILDPFCGSGTVLVEAMHSGISALGIDANPLAVLIARAKTWPSSPAERDALLKRAVEIANVAIERGREARRKGPAQRLFTPKGVDGVARNRRLAHWFAPHVRRELETLAMQIQNSRLRVQERDILRVLLSSVLYKVSKRTSDTNRDRVERKVARGRTARLFRDRAIQWESGLKELIGRRRIPRVRARSGDARTLSRASVAAASMTAIVTSPPYAGTYDYAAQHELRMVFLGLEDAAFRRAEMGPRRAFRGPSSASKQALVRYERDLTRAMRGMARVLQPGGVAALMLGDSVAGSRVVRARDVLERAASDVFELTAWARQARPKLGKLEQSVFASEPKWETVFLLRARTG